MIAWFVTGTILCCTPSSHHDDVVSKKEAAPVVAAADPAEGESNVSVDKVEHEDGSIVTRTTTTNPDGSKTVEETTETPLVDAVVDEKV